MHGGEGDDGDGEGRKVHDNGDGDVSVRQCRGGDDSATSRRPRYLNPGIVQWLGALHAITYYMHNNNRNTDKMQLQGIKRRDFVSDAGRTRAPYGDRVGADCVPGSFLQVKLVDSRLVCLDLNILGWFDLDWRCYEATPCTRSKGGRLWTQINAILLSRVTHLFRQFA